MLALVQFASFGQTSAGQYKARFQRQVKNLGVTGVGVETILDAWGRDFPQDGDMLEGRYAFYLAKSQGSEVVERSERKYLGLKPVLELKDSLGTPHYYYQVATYADSLFALSASSIESAISLYPDELKYRIDKITALCAYERESPDMTEAELLALIERNCTKPSWTFEGQPQDDEFFQSIIQEYCRNIFSLGTPRAYEVFLNISQKMSKLYPKCAVYLSNVGSYWFVAQNNPKKATSFYKKALKLDPEDFAATRNLKLIQSLQSRKGQSSK